MLLLLHYKPKACIGLGSFRRSVCFGSVVPGYVNLSDPGRSISAKSFSGSSSLHPYILSSCSEASCTCLILVAPTCFCLGPQRLALLSLPWILPFGPRGLFIRQRLWPEGVIPGELVLMSQSQHLTCLCAALVCACLCLGGSCSAWGHSSDGQQTNSLRIEG